MSDVVVLPLVPGQALQRSVLDPDRDPVVHPTEAIDAYLTIFEEMASDLTAP